MSKYLTVEDIIALEQTLRKKYLPPTRCKECYRSFYFIHEKGFANKPVINKCTDHAPPSETDRAPILDIDRPLSNGGIAPGVGSL